MSEYKFHVHYADGLTKKGLLSQKEFDSTASMFDNQKLKIQNCKMKRFLQKEFKMNFLFFNFVWRGRFSKNIFVRKNFCRL